MSRRVSLEMLFLETSLLNMWIIVTFTRKNQFGYCVCGAVPDAVTKELAQQGTHLFSVEGSIEAMSHFSSNPSLVVGYFLENKILRSVISAGIPCLDISGPMSQFVFEGFPPFDLTHEKALYVSKAFNFPAIDGVLFAPELCRQKG